jgi:hypothetical protein
LRRFLDKARSVTIGRSLRVILLLQVAIAGVLILTDIGARLRFNLAVDPMVPMGPVSPGDQVRRYDPSQTRPQFSDPQINPDLDLPDDMPARLAFSLVKDAELGALVLLYGGIESGDAARVDAYLASLADPPDAVAINSPGGGVDAALAIGQIIRDRGLDTHILSGMICLSACPYVLAGGVERQVSRNGAVGLHQHYYDTPGYLPVFFAVEDIQRSQGEAMAFLIAMGVDPAIMVHALTTPPDDIYVLVENELLESGFATLVTD